MTIKYCFALFFLCLATYGYSQERFTGFVKDAATGEVLIGATVATPNCECGTSTNANGYFSLLCKSDSANVSFVGYQQKRVKWVADSLVTIFLKAGQEISEVAVYAQKQQQFNTTTVSIQELKSIPALGGKPDVLKPCS